MNLLSDKVALITGGSAGIGRTTSFMFAREGAKVVVADINVAGGEETVKIIEEEGGIATFIKTDVSIASEVEEMINKTVETYGRLDCAFNNAGIPLHRSILECTEEEWDNIMNVNLKSVFLCMKYEIIQMLKNGGGAIVNTASIAGLVGTANVSAYVASKHGVIGLTKAIALEYVKKGIRVNAVGPHLVWSAEIERDEKEEPESPSNIASITFKLVEAFLRDWFYLQL